MNSGSIICTIATIKTSINFNSEILEVFKEKKPQNNAVMNKRYLFACVCYYLCCTHIILLWGGGVPCSAPPLPAPLPLYATLVYVNT